MIARYLVVAGRIRQELATLERVVTRVERAAHTLEQLPEYQDLMLDATALNLQTSMAAWSVSGSILPAP